ncbi:hypothetical protein [Flavobacterium sp. H4147]|uniref:hypothetical protein n=1 Tax=Flavobacterium sp. H4147 TaxID=3034149 RepID=UPI0023EB4E0F|nr:hypothetical protein [Flavobacterium sp. H4147]
MKKLTYLLLIVSSLKISAQIISPNGNNIFYYNGAADVIFKYPERGSGGRAFVHAPNNVLALNYAEDFSGGTLIGKNTYFKDDGNSFIYSGNFGIGTSAPVATLDLKKLNSNLVFDLDTNGLCKIISKGWNANIDIHTFQINGTENINQLYLKTNGNVGIGTNNPNAPLTVYGVSNFFPARIGSGDARSLEISNTGSFRAFLDNDYPIFLKTGGGNQPLILDAARIGIGTANPSSMLTVAGNIAAREVKVTVDAGADFVFEKDYKLPSLESVDKFIKENKHLPEIASAEEMKKDGINLSEMNIKLLQKIEELTLYTIELNKKNNTQSEEIANLKDQVNLLKEENESLHSISERLSKLEKQLK